MRCIVTLLFYLIVIRTSHAQTDLQVKQAATEGRKAMSLIKRGREEEAIRLLKHCIRLDPSSIIYPLETAFAYYLLQKPKKALNILERLKFHRQANARVYQLLSRCYGGERNVTKQLEAVTTGLKRFPAAGNLHTEMGVNYLLSKDTATAMTWFQKGAALDPQFSTNFYYISLINAVKGNFLTSFRNGEVYMNLERTGYDVVMISRLLFFTRNKYLLDQQVPIKDDHFKKLYNERDFYRIDTICRQLLQEFNKAGSLKDSLSFKPVFENRRKISHAGHAEAYLYWLFQHGDEKGFYNWKYYNIIKWTAFVKWFNEYYFPAGS